MEFLKLKENLEQHVELSDDEFNTIIQCFKFKKLKKKEYFLKAGEVSKEEAYVVSGCLKKYFSDESSKEHILCFFPENYLVCEIQSFTTQKPSLTSIRAIEDSLLLTLNINDKNKLLDSNPKFDSLSRIMIQKLFIINQQRIIDSLTKTAEQRYKEFIQKKPNLASRLTNKDMAAYLGITHEFVSIIRKKIVTNKKLN